MFQNRGAQTLVRELVLARFQGEICKYFVPDNSLWESKLLS